MERERIRVFMNRDMGIRMGGVKDRSFSSSRPLSSPCLCVFVVSFLALTTGCASWDLTSKLPWASSEQKLQKEKFQRPVRMVVIWTPTTLSQPGKPITRGLGGRIYFYNDVDEAIPVEGQLIVYAYDDSAQRQNVSHINSQGGVDEPTRRYAFTAEQFKGHFDPTDLGASYSVWIPWGPVDGPAVKVSVVPVFTSSSGNIVMAQASRNVLKGTQPLMSERAEEEVHDGVVRVGHQTKQTELRTTTIPVNETIAERMLRAGEQQYVPQAGPLENPRENVPAPAAQIDTEARATAQTITPATAMRRGVPPPWTPQMPPPARVAPPRIQAPESPDREPAPAP